MLRRLVDGISGEPYYVNAIDQQFRRAVLALAWPMEPIAGAIVVLGELRHKPTVIGEARHIHLLDEVRSHNPAELIHDAERLMRQNHVPRIITPDDDARSMLIDVENDQRRAQRRYPLRYEPPIQWRGKGTGMLTYYLSLLQTRLVGAKTIFFGPSSSLPSEVSQASTAQQQTTEPRMDKWPGVCALCWAVEAIDCNPMHEWSYGAMQPGGHADAIGGY